MEHKTGGRIQSIKAIPLNVPLSRDFGGSQYHVTRRCTIITVIQTDDGLVSQVYNGDNRDQASEVIRLIDEELAPRIIGESIFQVERVWATMFATSHKLRSRRSLVLEAIACVDTAIWDLFGRALGASVSTLLGRYRTELPIISIGGYYEADKTLADISREMERYRELGMAGCKFKVGGLSPEEDARRTVAAREGGGPADQFILAVDANRGWTAVDAIRFAQLVEPLDIRWFEEPCHWYDDVAAMAQVRQHTRIPITAGQSEITSHGVRRLLTGGAVDIVNFDASEGGGVTEWRRAAGMCATFGAELAHHEEPQIAAQLLSAVPNGTYVECFADVERDPIWDRLIENRASIRDGILQVPSGPGFGLSLDAQVIERWRTDRP